MFSWFLDSCLCRERSLATGGSEAVAGSDRSLPSARVHGRVRVLWSGGLQTARAVSCHSGQSGLTGETVPNFVRFTFLHLDAAHDLYPDWDLAADTCVAVLHAEAGRDPHDKALHDLVGELSTRSDDFRRRWSSRNVRSHGAGTKQFHHRDVGDLQLAYESMDMLSDPGLTLTLYAAEPGSATAHALDLLASWTAPPSPQSRPPPCEVDSGLYQRYVPGQGVPHT